MKPFPGFKRIVNARLGEERLEARLPCGLHLCFAPRRGFAASFAMFTFRFGAADIGYRIGKGRRAALPMGCAHFLEHQLFKKADGDVGEEFASRGANANAHTGYASTSYHVESVGAFEDNLATLIRLCFDPYFDEKLVATEREIVRRELLSYRDHPAWMCHQNLLAILYHNHPVRVDIVGDEESLERIDAKTLARAYEAFYTPNNAGLFVSGDLDPGDLFRFVLPAMAARRRTAKRRGVSRAPCPEPHAPRRRSIHSSMYAGSAQAIVGYKGVPPRRPSWRRAARAEVAGGMALDLMFGRGTEFFDALYSEGIVTGSFTASYQSHYDFSYASIGGETSDAKELERRIEARIASWLEHGPDKSDVERKKRKVLGRFLRNFESPEATASAHSDAWLDGVDTFELIPLVESITPREVWAFARELFKPSQRAVSTVLPAGRGARVHS